MSSTKDLELLFWDCRRMRTSHDVIAAARAVANEGLLPAEGVYTKSEAPRPVDDLEIFIPTRYRDRRALYPQRRFRRLEEVQSWAFPLVLPEQPKAYATMRVQVFHPEMWSVALLIGTWALEGSVEARESRIKQWGSVLEDVGMRLYSLCRPVAGAIVPVGGTEHGPRFLHAGPRRDLMVGWRTWLGTEYIDRYGHDVLAALPDRTIDLDDGGLYHQLGVSLAEFASNERRAYRGVIEFFQQHGIKPEWPPLRSIEEILGSEAVE